MIVCGTPEYMQHVRKAAPYKMMALDAGSLVEALDYVLTLRRDRLYCVLMLTPRGVTIERTELPDLPASKAMILQSTKRAVQIYPYQPWIESIQPADAIVLGQYATGIVIEEK